LKDDIDEEVDGGQPSPMQLKWAQPRALNPTQVELSTKVLNCTSRALELNRAPIRQWTYRKVAPITIGVESDTNVVQNLFKECLC